MVPLPIRQSILHTLQFFDMFDAVLTPEEIHMYLWRGGNASFDSTKKALQQLTSDGTVLFERGYYGMRLLADTRIARIPLVDKRFKKAVRAAQILRYIPFIRGVFICNNLAFDAVSEKSDIDVFIVTAPKRIWIVRFFSTMILRLLRIAITRGRIANRVCLSFYATTHALNLSTVTITDPDIYLMYWVRTLVPLYDPHNVYADIQNKNTWIRPYIGALSKRQLHAARCVTDTILSRSWRRMLEAWWLGAIGDMIEQQAKEFQKVKMKLKWHSVQDEPDTRVVVSDDMLKFHENDRRVEYKEKWESRVANHIS